MDTTRLDGISRLFAQRRLSRRQAMQQGAAGLAAAGLAAAGLKVAAAQNATPATTAAGADADKPSFLFVQTFGAGELAPKPGEEGTLTLTADHLAGQTVYFSDRPERIVGMVDTSRFLGTGSTGGTGTPAAGGLGFTPADPPNAALVFAGAAGEDSPGDVMVVELIDPTYDPATGRATYDVKVLADETSVDLTLVSEPVTAAAAAAARQFEGASLLIDDCPDGTISCVAMDGTHIGGLYVGDSPSMGFCYDAWSICCAPCAGGDSDHWADQCNDVWFPDQCNGKCVATAYNESWACNM